jgi:hypothetical protein
VTLLGWTALLYLCNLGLGVGLQLRLFHLRWPMVHHVLYGVIFALTLLSLWVLLNARANVWPLLLSVGLLSVLPRTRGGKPSHALVALGIGLGYLLTLTL